MNINCLDDDRRVLTWRWKIEEVDGVESAIYVITEKVVMMVGGDGFQQLSEVITGAEA